MKKFRFILVLAMAVVISGGVISTSRVVNAATDINFHCCYCIIKHVK